MTLRLCGGLTEGCGHGRVLHGGLAVSGGQVGSGEVAALFVVVFDVEAGEFGEADPQRAAAVVDVLSVQRLKPHQQVRYSREEDGSQPSTVLVSVGPAERRAHQFSCLGRRSVRVLQQSLELTVLGEDDDPQHCAEL